ncbi:hypothetical protein ACH4HG_16330 [Streptomyces coeruleorubidus]|uniref:hypothetical protein n=1 Tax=Streptomyces coeruleorubidus TaxID=116188 RepID=UPI00379491A0
MVILSVNLNSIVADDVYRITEQANRTTCQYKRLKHHKVDEYRDVPLPYHIASQWKRIKKAGQSMYDVLSRCELRTSVATEGDRQLGEALCARNDLVAPRRPSP